MSFRGRPVRSPFVSASTGSNYVYGASKPPAAGRPDQKSLEQAFPIATRMGGTVVNNFPSMHEDASLEAYRSAASHHQSTKRRVCDEDDDEYFDEDPAEEPTGGARERHDRPASGSRSSSGVRPEEDEEEDPLDAFMADIAKETKKSSAVSAPHRPSTQPSPAVPPPPDGAAKKAYRADIEEEDNEESYFRFMRENPNAGLAAGEEDIPLEYDEDGNPIAPQKSKHIDPLPPIDHAQMEYAPFEKNFYQEHEDIVKLNSAQVNELRQKWGIRVSGASPPKPVASFAHFNFDEALMKAIRKLEFTQPTPIQAQAIPAVLQGRDVIGIAKTGSGKTAAYLWPLLMHVMDQPPLRPGDGPIGLILAPTRELAQQIYNEVRKFGTKVYNLTTTCIAGGSNKHEQSQALKHGAEIVVATPGRMIDMIKSKVTNLQRVTFIVLDEADRMLDLGFEPQVRSICNHVRPDRQTLLFSATFKKNIERLARDALLDPIRIVQGELGEANEDVTQFIKILPNVEEKWAWLLRNIVSFTSTGSVLIFVTKKANSEDVAARLQRADHKCGLIHGDLHQTERDKVLHQFKKKELPILVATDVAARGLDIASIRTVINFDVARDIDTHTHRIGRTGRAGEQGAAYTLVVPQDKEFTPHLVRNLEGANQHVPEKLLELAEQCSWFKKTRFKGGKGKKPVGGRGIGFKESKASTHEESVSDMIKSARDEVGAASSSAPGTNRFAAMKAVFQNKFKQQFAAASSPETGQLPPDRRPPAASEPDAKKRRTRWE
ncbi:ATP-dependent RNA helicase DDX42-like [Paramacrobiotus metropolitanus]|uniref:ATP-dependent RNA helicase DDX42-like n=1 Tax=Paramacrobiotus metropolitanus TaxID=2943436 RepID=UPI0024462F83|nr:ATP-dependent RNA helicase DDX42-like [Paramacrobiotus metropolitanus]